VGDTQLRREVVTRRDIDGFKNTQEREIAPGALLERTSDGEKKKKRGRWVHTPFTVGRICRVTEGRRCRRKLDSFSQRNGSHPKKGIIPVVWYRCQNFALSKIKRSWNCYCKQNKHKARVRVPKKKKQTNRKKTNTRHVLAKTCENFISRPGEPQG